MTRPVADAPPTLTAFAVAAPGLEPLVAAELDALGLAPAIERGGVAWNGTLESLALANLWLRTASRVIVRVASFRARSFRELERHARRLAWERFVSARTLVRFRVTTRKSRLYHSDAIAERLADAADARAGATPAPSARRRAASAGTRRDDDECDDDEATAQTFIVRVSRDVVTLSADSSGALLHRRGYRQAVAKAPLRETIAAAMLLGSEWPASAPLIDPMCGSGTIPIEAALLGRRIAPGAGREFAFQRWPEFDGAVWSRLVERAREQELPRAPAAIRGSDRDAGAVEAARGNAERAGVAADVEVYRSAISAIEPVGVRGWVVTNPPYGVRVGDAGRGRDLYAALGNVLRERFAGWRLAVLSADRSLDRQVGVALRERLATVNGGIPVRLLTGEIET